MFGLGIRLLRASWVKSAEKARNLAEITLLRIVARSECGTADADVAVYVHSDFRGGEIYF